MKLLSYLLYRIAIVPCFVHETDAGCFLAGLRIRIRMFSDLVSYLVESKSTFWKKVNLDPHFF